MLVSRLAVYHQNDDRFLGFGFFAVSYVAPNPDVDVDAVNAMTKPMIGYELFGYWPFFAEPGASKLIQEHVS